MGAIRVTVALKSAGGSGEAYQEVFLVDPGATDSLAPRSGLAAAGIEPVGKMTYELADGTPHEYEFGLARIEFIGEITAGRVIFGPDDAKPSLA